jgi:hypothetical protein
MSLIVIIESFFEIPCHILFPKNIIYLHTNYFKIYDIVKYRQVQLLYQIVENIFILISLFETFKSGNAGIISILMLSFSIVMFVYYLSAEIFYIFITEAEESGPTDDYGRRLKKKVNVEKNNLKINSFKFELKRDRYLKNIKDDQLNSDSESENNNVRILQSKKEIINDQVNVKYVHTVKSSDGLNN